MRFAIRTTRKGEKGVGGFAQKLYATIVARPYYQVLKGVPTVDFLHFWNANT
jgi:hypothetical protein